MKFHFSWVVFLILMLSLQGELLFASGTNNINIIQSFRESGEIKAKPTWFERFQPYKMNYAIWQNTSSDESAAEVQYSLKYNLTNIEIEDNMHNVYLAYTGKFDFYMGTRESGPVINRVSNPSIHYRYGFHTGKKSTCWIDSELEYYSPPPTVGDTKESPSAFPTYQKYTKCNTWWIDFGIEHRSNGQVTDVATKDTNPASTTFGKYIAQIEYEKGNHKYFDGISRGANYVSITPSWKYTDLDRNGIKYDRDKLELESKIYFTNDSNITWGPLAGSDRRFSDYDLVRVLYSHTHALYFDHLKDVTMGFEYVIGAKGFATDSIDLFLVVPWYSKTAAWKIPFFVKSHFGPMDRLSNYTQSMRSVGFGLALAY